MILTRSELRVLQIACTGMDAKHIATVLGVGKRTVDWHLGNAYKKLRAGNLIEAYNRAMAYGLIEPPIPNRPVPETVSGGGLPQREVL